MGIVGRSVIILIGLVCVVVLFEYSANRSIYDAIISQMMKSSVAEDARARFQARSVVSENHSNKSSTRMIILIHSGAALKEQRDLQRKICFPLYKDIPHYFVVGIPSFDDRKVDAHAQGQLPTEKETNVSMMLLEEHRQYGDIMVAPHRDYYRDLNEKILFVLRFGVEQGADYILKADDDYCINVNASKHMIDEHEKIHSHDELYGGLYYFSGTEYPTLMLGPHNETAPFMSGHIILLSKKLAEILIGRDWITSVLRGAYGTSSDDANLGKMIVRAQEKHNVSVNVVVDQRMQLCEVKKHKDMSDILKDCKIMMDDTT